ncbi:MAG: hypothetical protein IJQ89_03865 [Bacteroidales bacterium]|nr:hypothetical protein [Bacteroidales bacterium]
MDTTNCALLTNQGKYTVFKYGDCVIRFIAPYSLERYTEVKTWDNGYIVVMAKYAHNDKSEEEYIDLVPILEDLYINSDVFLEPIKKVAIE